MTFLCFRFPSRLRGSHCSVHWRTYLDLEDRSLRAKEWCGYWCRKVRSPTIKEGVLGPRYEENSHPKRLAAIADSYQLRSIRTRTVVALPSSVAKHLVHIDWLLISNPSQATPGNLPRLQNNWTILTWSASLSKYPHWTTPHLWQSLLGRNYLKTIW